MLKLCAALLLFASLAFAGDVDYAPLVVKLTDADFDARDKAREQLKAAGYNAKAALEAALANADADLRAQLNDLLEPIRRRDDYHAEIQWLNKHVFPLFGARTLENRVVRPRATPLPDDWKVLDSAYAWLAANQEADGHWDSRKHGAETEADLEQTALALLAFSINGRNTTVKGDFKANVQRAIAWLTSQMNEHGEVRADWPQQRRIVSQSIVLYALSETAGWEKQKETKALAQKAAGALARLATSRTDWNVLHIAFAAFGLKQARVNHAQVTWEEFKPLDQWLEKNHRENEKATYYFDSGTKHSVLASLAGSIAQAQLGFKLHDDWHTNVQRYRSQDAVGEDAFFTLWSANLSVFRREPNLNDVLKQAVRHCRELQRTTGPERGSFEPHGLWSGAGRVFSTSFAAFFEVYRRSQWYGQWLDENEGL